MLGEVLRRAESNTHCGGFLPINHVPKNIQLACPPPMINITHHAGPWNRLRCSEWPAEVKGCEAMGFRAHVLKHIKFDELTEKQRNELKKRFRSTSENSKWR